MATITVRKHTWEGLFRYAWQGEVLARDEDVLLVQATWNGPGEPLVDEIRFAAGDCFLEYYYLQRPYAIWEVRTAAHVLKGWYCNINTLPMINEDVLRFDDLLLDVIVYPDGRYTVLDRDEFEAARGAGLPTTRATLAESALAEVLALIRAGAAPFTFAPSTSVLVGS